MVYSSVLVFSSDFLCLAFLVRFFSDGENDTKTEMVWKENILSVFGSKCSFPIYAD